MDNNLLSFFSEFGNKYLGRQLDKSEIDDITSSHDDPQSIIEATYSRFAPDQILTRDRIGSLISDYAIQPLKKKNQAPLPSRPSAFSESQSSPIPQSDIPPTGDVASTPDLTGLSNKFSKPATKPLDVTQLENMRHQQDPNVLTEGAQNLSSSITTPTVDQAAAVVEADVQPDVIQEVNVTQPVPDEAFILEQEKIASERNKYVSRQINKAETDIDNFFNTDALYNTGNIEPLKQSLYSLYQETIPAEKLDAMIVGAEQNALQYEFARIMTNFPDIESADIYAATQRELEQIRQQAIDKGYSEAGVDTYIAGLKANSKQNYLDRSYGTIYNFVKEQTGSSDEEVMAMIQHSAVSDGLKLFDETEIEYARLNARYIELSKKPNRTPQEIEEYNSISLKLQKLSPTKKEMYDPITGEQIVDEGFLAQYKGSLQQYENQYAQTPRDLLGKAYMDAWLELRTTQSKFEASKLNTEGQETTEYVADTRDYYKQYFNALAKFEAVSKLYLLNESPVQVEEDLGFWGSVGYSVGIVRTGISEGFGMTRSDVRDRDILDKMNEVFTETGITPTQSQADAMAYSFNDQLATMVGGAIPMAVEFYAVNKVFELAKVGELINGTASILGSGSARASSIIGASTPTAVKFGRITEGVVRELGMTASEGLKFSAIGGDFETGASFYWGMKFLPPIFKAGARLNKFKTAVNTMYRVGVGMTAATELSPAIVAVYDAATGDKDLMSEIEEAYPSLNELGTNIICGLIVNSVIFGALPTIQSVRAANGKGKAVVVSDPVTIRLVSDGLRRAGEHESADLVDKQIPKIERQIENAGGEQNVEFVYKNEDFVVEKPEFTPIGKTERAAIGEQPTVENLSEQQRVDAAEVSATVSMDRSDPVVVETVANNSVETFADALRIRNKADGKRSYGDVIRSAKFQSDMSVLQSGALVEIPKAILNASIEALAISADGVQTGKQLIELSFKKIAESEWYQKLSQPKKEQAEIEWGGHVRGILKKYDLLREDAVGETEAFDILRDVVEPLKVDPNAPSGIDFKPEEVPSEIWNRAIEAVAIELRSGNNISRAAKSGWEAISKTEWGKKLKRKEFAKLEEHFTSVVNGVWERKYPSGIRTKADVNRFMAEEILNEVETTTTLNRIKGEVDAAINGYKDGVAARGTDVSKAELNEMELRAVNEARKNIFEVIKTLRPELRSAKGTVLASLLRRVNGLSSLKDAEKLSSTIMKYAEDATFRKSVSEAEIARKKLFTMRTGRGDRDIITKLKRLRVADIAEIGIEAIKEYSDIVSAYNKDGVIDIVAARKFVDKYNDVIEESIARNEIYGDDIIIESSDPMVQTTIEKFNEDIQSLAERISKMQSGEIPIDAQTLKSVRRGIGTMRRRANKLSVENADARMSALDMLVDGLNNVDILNREFKADEHSRMVREMSDDNVIPYKENGTHYLGSDPATRVEITESEFNDIRDFRSGIKNITASEMDMLRAEEIDNASQLLAQLKIGHIPSSIRDINTAIKSVRTRVVLSEQVPFIASTAKSIDALIRKMGRRNLNAAARSIIESDKVSTAVRDAAMSPIDKALIDAKKWSNALLSPLRKVANKAQGIFSSRKYEYLSNLIGIGMSQMDYQSNIDVVKIFSIKRGDVTTYVVERVDGSRVSIKNENGKWIDSFDSKEAAEAARETFLKNLDDVRRAATEKGMQLRDMAELDRHRQSINSGKEPSIKEGMLPSIFGSQRRMRDAAYRKLVEVCKQTSKYSDGKKVTENDVFVLDDNTGAHWNRILDALPKKYRELYTEIRNILDNQDVIRRVEQAAFENGVEFVYRKDYMAYMDMTGNHSLDTALSTLAGPFSLEPGRYSEEPGMIHQKTGVINAVNYDIVKVVESYISKISNYSFANNDAMMINSALKFTADRISNINIKYKNAYDNFINNNPEGLSGQLLKDAAHDQGMIAAMEAGLKEGETLPDKSISNIYNAIRGDIAYRLAFSADNSILFGSLGVIGNTLRRLTGISVDVKITTVSRVLSDFAAGLLKSSMFTSHTGSLLKNLATQRGDAYHDFLNSLFLGQYMSLRASEVRNKYTSEKNIYGKQTKMSQWSQFATTSFADYINSGAVWKTAFEAKYMEQSGEAIDYTKMVNDAEYYENNIRFVEKAVSHANDFYTRQAPGPQDFSRAYRMFFTNKKTDARSIYGMLQGWTMNESRNLYDAFVDIRRGNDVGANVSRIMGTLASNMLYTTTRITVASAVDALISRATGNDDWEDAAYERIRSAYEPTSLFTNLISATASLSFGTGGNISRMALSLGYAFAKESYYGNQNMSSSQKDKAIRNLDEIVRNTGLYSYIKPIKVSGYGDISKSTMEFVELVFPIATEGAYTYFYETPYNLVTGISDAESGKTELA